jgi:hypothetical protein
MKTKISSDIGSSAPLRPPCMRAEPVRLMRIHCALDRRWRLLHWRRHIHDPPVFDPRHAMGFSWSSSLRWCRLPLVCGQRTTEEHAMARLIEIIRTGSAFELQRYRWYEIDGACL